MSARRRLIPMLMIVALLAGLGCSDGVTPPDDMTLFILAGQSNMDGRGPVEEYTPIDTEGRVYLFGKDHVWRVAEEPFSERGVGPGLAFAKELLASDSSMVIGLIPCAVGGSPIDWWRKDHPERTIYKRMMDQTTQAMVHGKVAGFLFLQGERDAYNDVPAYPEEWADRFVALVEDVRSDVNDPELPVVFGQIGRVDSVCVKAELVRQQQASVTIKNATMITTLDLPLQDDSLHFTTPAYMVLGKRFADAWLSLQD